MAPQVLWNVCSKKLAHLRLYLYLSPGVTPRARQRPLSRASLTLFCSALIHIRMPHITQQILGADWQGVVTWPVSISFVAYGVRVGVRVNRPEAAARILECLPPHWRVTRSEYVERVYSLFFAPRNRCGLAVSHVLYSDNEELLRTTDPDQVFETLESHLQLYIAERARRRVFLHAGAVGWRGSAIVIPGRSYSGKTTLVAELIRAGAAYYSDEYAVLDSKGRVHPYSRPLAVRHGSTPKQTKHSVEDFGGTAGVKPIPVGMVIISRYKSGSSWHPVALSPGHGVLEMLANTVPAQSNPAFVLYVLRQVALRAHTFHSMRGEAADTARSILQSC